MASADDLVKPVVFAAKRDARPAVPELKSVFVCSTLSQAPAQPEAFGPLALPV